MEDIAQLDPRNFKNLNSAETSHDDHTLRVLAQLTGINRSELCRELIQFATHYEDYNAVPQTSGDSDRDFELNVDDRSGTEEQPDTMDEIDDTIFTESFKCEKRRSTNNV